MSLERSPDSSSQVGLDIALDTSPALNTYLLVCNTEGKSDNTIKTYKQRILSMLQHAGKPEAEITTNDALMFLYELRHSGKVGKSTINAYFRAVHTYFEWCVAWKVIRKSPLNGVKAPSFKEKQPTPFTGDELRLLLLVTSGERFIDIRNRAMILLFLETGIRLQELSGINIADADMRTGFIKVTGKGDKERTVVIQKETRKAILRYLLQRTDSHKSLWVSEERRPLTRDGVRSAVVKLCRRAGIKGGPHKFRHTAAIHCLRNGMGVFTLQMMLGHSTLRMTRRYANLVNEDLIREHEKASPVENLKL